MRNRLARLGAVAVGLLALVGGLTPPAQAQTVLAAAFVGTATLQNPLGYPCLGTAPIGGTPTLDLRLCPATPLFGTKTVTIDNSLPLTTTVGGTTVTTPQPQVKVTHGANGQTPVQLLAPTLPLCVDLGVNVLKGTKPPAQAGLCTFGLTNGSLPNTVSGNCGLSSGQVTVLFTDDGVQNYTIDTHFTAVGGLLILTGHSTKAIGGTKGLVIGAVVAVPPLPLVGDGTSCLTKTAKTFTLVGVLVGVGTN
jgi:hypothetical protein